MNTFKHLRLGKDVDQDGINIVDLMMWLVIAALLLAAALQSIGYYQKAAYVKQAVQSLENAGSVTMATAAMKEGVVTPSVLTASLTEAKSSNDVTMFHQKAPWNSSEYILVAQHPEVTDQYIIYLFKPYGDWAAGVNVVSKSAMQSLGGVFAGETAFSGGPKINNLVFPEFNTSGSYLQDIYLSTGATNLSKMIAISVDAPKADAANYSIEWKKTGFTELGLGSSLSAYSSPSSKLVPAWYFTVTNGSTPLPSGTASVTAVITEKATGQTASHTWDIYANGDFALYQDYDKYGVAKTKQVHSGSTKYTEIGKVFALPYPKASYDVTMTSEGMDAIGAKPTMTPGANTEWDFTMTPAVNGVGYSVGNASVTLNAKHKVSGIEHKFTIPISVTSPQGTVFTLEPFTNTGTMPLDVQKAAVGSTTRLSDIFSTQPTPLFNLNDYTPKWTGDLTALNADVYPQAGGSYGNTGYSLYVVPRTGGLQAGTVNVQLEVTYNLTGQKATKNFTFIVE